MRYAPLATPAAIRSASIWVLPEPAPATTSRFVPSSSRATRRDSESMRRDSLMCAELLECLQLQVVELRRRARSERTVTRRRVIAERAGLLFARVRERAADDGLAQVCEHAGGRRSRRRRNRQTLVSPAMTGEVIHAGRYLRIRRL